jgi:hypothetical protein
VAIAAQPALHDRADRARQNPGFSGEGHVM